MNNLYRTKYAIEDNVLYAKTDFNDKFALNRNQVIRNEKILEQGRLKLHENEDIRLAISCPDACQWGIFKTDYPDIYDGLGSDIESERMSAAQQLAILHPEWVVMNRL